MDVTGVVVVLEEVEDVVGMLVVVVLVVGEDAPETPIAPKVMRLARTSVVAATR